MKTTADQPQTAAETRAARAAAQPDHRPAAVAQRQQQAAIAASPRQQNQATLASLPAPNRTGLPDALKTGVENLSGYSLDDVRVHYNSAQPAQLQAHAYAQGTDIHLAPGQEKHLPHEAWHVVQQKQGRVQATRQLKGAVPVNDDAGLEQEADVMGSRAAAYSPTGTVQRQVSAHTPGCGCSACSSPTTQRKPTQHKSTQPTVQRCVSCGDSSCVKGEKCGYDRSEDGLFSSHASTSALPVLPYGSSNAKKNSGKAFGTELEHPIPGQALRLIGEGAGYRQEYTIPIDKQVHRGGVSGAGGGISSTGSSHTSRGWAQHLAAQNDYGMVRDAMKDQINAHIMQGGFSEEVSIQIKDWLLAQRDQEGRIDQGEYDTLLNILLNRYHDQA